MAPGHVSLIYWYDFTHNIVRVKVERECYTDIEGFDITDAQLLDGFSKLESQFKKELGKEPEKHDVINGTVDNKKYAAIIRKIRL